MRLPFGAPLVLLAACGDPSSMMTGPDAAGDDAANPDAPPGCTEPSLSDPALRTYLSGALSRLPAPRATTTQRTTARTFLTTELTSLGLSPQLDDYATGANVIATLPATMGTGKGIIVGAHFDTVGGSPGANDNGSGTAVVLAVASILADTPCRTSPVTFAWFDEEEVGLVGARAYANSLNPADFRAVHTIDQVAFDNDGDHRFELESPPAGLEQEWRAAAGVIGVPVTKTSTEGTDHEAFRDRGFAAIGLTEEFVGGDTSPFRHTAQDTVGTVDNDYLTLAMQLTARVVLDEIAPR
jgi:acetylornithine deacetylase/succinyl-diaminopimelate desuccinylase-like protein